MVAWRYEVSLLVEKFRISAYPCNILYILNVDCAWISHKNRVFSRQVTV